MTPGTTLFGIFGYLRETKRVLPCINAFRRLYAVSPDTALLIAGEVVSGDLSRLLENEQRHPAIHRVGRLDEMDFLTAAAAVDCCLNLRYPPAGETSGIAIRLTRNRQAGDQLQKSPETAEIPASACLRVPAGVDEPAVPVGSNRRSSRRIPVRGQRLGHRSRARHISSRHSLKKIAAKL